MYYWSYLIEHVNRASHYLSLYSLSQAFTTMTKVQMWKWSTSKLIKFKLGEERQCSIHVSLLRKSMLSPLPMSQFAPEVHPTPSPRYCEEWTNFTLQVAWVYMLSKRSYPHWVERQAWEAMNIGSYIHFSAAEDWILLFVLPSTNFSHSRKGKEPNNQGMNRT